jgi:hypothetical protein
MRYPRKDGHQTPLTHHVFFQLLGAYVCCSLVSLLLIGCFQMRLPGLHLLFTIFLFNGLTKKGLITQDANGQRQSRFRWESSLRLANPAIHVVFTPDAVCVGVSALLGQVQDGLFLRGLYSRWEV